MFYEVKVFDSEGHLKKTVSSKKLSNQFWRNNDSSPPQYEEGQNKSEDLGLKNNIKSVRVSQETSL